MKEQSANNKNVTLDQLSKKMDSNEAKKEVDNDGYDLKAEVSVVSPKKPLTVDLGWKENWNLIAGLAILIIVLLLEYGFKVQIPKIPALIINAIAYLFAGYKVLNLAFRKSIRGDFFNEFVLMSIATLGAFLIGEYDEGVAVMVFYGIGEWFQSVAVKRAKANIKALLDIRPEEVAVVRDGTPTVVHPSKVELGETIQLKPGEKVALDGELISENASFNTAALTGESKPDTKYKGETVLAGMVNLNTVAQVKVNALFKDSKLSRILEMVQDATARKSQTQLFISRFAKVYTPIVFFLALSLVVIPYFVVDNYVFYTWFYRALVFLVISCPCALVVSIPLGYFGGIGLASRNGILFKGGNFLDVMTKINAVVMDKTGTLTKGVFKVQQIVPNVIDKDQLVQLTAALERNSTHPVGKAIVEYAENGSGNYKVENVEEIAGHGLKGLVDGKELLAGNQKLMKKFHISYPAGIDRIADTIILIAINGQHAGHITIADEIKEDAKEAVENMHKLGIRTVMLSGDKQAVVDSVAKQIGIDEAYGDLLPEDKVNLVQKIKNEGRHIAFVGDGVNDAPVVALADAGIAMGGLGSDATIETADVVIQNDEPSRIVSAIKAGKITRRIVWQNIFLAMTVKIIVLALGAGGVANLWEAVIADVGVALLAIMNAVRIQRMKI
ncbi:cadmium-translocating P-type ATPase [Chitinophaga pendula]|uniref:heavy metal translocating P-type ATPase n=1 Tax=Chitinophaga TaxID=79328 RepID=UPI0018DFB7A4|nr:MULTISPECIES: heavy metal translocating P-type ATPase [Chitinophaga]UCJ07469.1 cadmium-translocating P-type ATPase [Chitinophaga pendula]